MPLRAALYLCVSTARQAEHDVSIPDQKRQGEACCAARGYELVGIYVEPGASATVRATFSNMGIVENSNVNPMRRAE
jgi:DNA invertase Pin-like site-specific DNA recombinase